MINLRNGKSKALYLAKHLRWMTLREREFSTQYGGIVVPLFQDVAETFRQTLELEEALEKIRRGSSDIRRLLEEQTLKVGLSRLEEFDKSLVNALSSKSRHSIRAREEDQVTRLLQAWCNQRASISITSITNTQQKAVRNLVGKMDRGEATIEETTKAIQAEGKNRWEWRRVARTELHDVATYSSLEAAKASKVVEKKEWVTAEDGRERPHHQAANGQTVGLEENFWVGGESISRPGEGSAGNAIHCRCIIIFTTFDS